MKAPPAWLAELHRQWQLTRGSRIQKSTTVFSRDWQDLLDAAGLHTAEERMASAREATALEEENHLRLGRQRYGDAILRVRLPVAQEAWLRGLFQSDDPAAVHGRSVAVIEEFRAGGHPLYPDLWRVWCGHLLEIMAAGRSQRPFHWRHPEKLRVLLSLVHALTSREWPAGMLIRDVDVKLDLPTKTIEKQRRAIEAALGQLFGRDTPLEALGILNSNSRLLFDGPLTLHFPDGTVDISGGLRHGDFVTAADLDRAVRITTTATRILSVENSKTTFRHLARVNTARDTLIFATSFPTQAVRILLEKLPPSLPHWHFGDTDPAGYFILLKLRQLTARPVRSWSMDWRDASASPPLTTYDRRTLTALLAAHEISDCRADLQAMRAAGRKGAWEQENRSALLPHSEAP